MYGIIYKVLNKVNQKIYIGQTKNTLQRRMAAHKCSAITKKSNSYFHKAIRKYGWDSFSWEIICFCKSKEELDKKEIIYIHKYSSHVSLGFGYNLTKGGDFNPMSDPEIKRRADVNRAIAMKSFCGEYNVMKRPIVKEKHHAAILHMVTTEEWKKPTAIGNEKQKSIYEITFPDGHIETIKGLNQFCKDHNLQQSKMSSVSSGERPHHKNFICKKIEQRGKTIGNNNLNKEYYFKNNNEKVVVTNLNEFCKENFLSYTCMLYVQQGKQPAHRGFSKWI
jgi:group I intron endonuclease